jgi:hypothetical protein
MLLSIAGGAAAQTGAPPRSESPSDWRKAWATPVKAAPIQATPAQTSMEQKTPVLNVVDPSTFTTNKGFSAAIHLVDVPEADRFIRDWNQNDTTTQPKLRPARRVSRGQSIVLLMLYSGCSGAPTGPAPCTATIDVKTFDPNGKTIMEQFDIPLARNLQAYPNIVQLSPVTLQTDFDASDIKGLYRYDVTLRNPERNAVIRLTDTIVLDAVLDAVPGEAVSKP